jgi:hydrogenase maturation protein HypF
MSKTVDFTLQPIACHICGPQATLERADGKPITASMYLHAG